jgi:protein-L-isoaspartate(D-aspartate) O-methyltransferase
MRAMTASKERLELVADLRAKGAIGSERVAAAFAAVARECFLPELLAGEGLAAVYRDDAIVTKRDSRGMPLSSSSQPALMAKMLELLELREGQRVLEIGAGTGYNAALLAHMVGATGTVTTIDVDAELARKARRAIRDAGYRARVIVADGRLGAPGDAPFDRIIVTACADEMPRAWLEQLAQGGRLELPLRLDPDGAAIQLIPVLERRRQRLHLVDLTWGGFMPLHGGDGGWRPPGETLTASRSHRERHSALTSISGGGLARLSDGAARTVLASMLTTAAKPRAQGMTPIGSSHPPLLLIYLLLKIPASRRVSVHGGGRLGIGIVDRGAGGLAVLSVPTPWKPGKEKHEKRARWRLDTYGAGTAGTELEALLAEWQEFQRTGRDRLQLTAHGSGEPLRLRFGWGSG